MTAMEQNHRKLQKWRNKIFIHYQSISENTVNNFVGSFSLRTQPGQQLWHWVSQAFLEPLEREHNSSGTKPLAAPCHLCQGKGSLAQKEAPCGKQGHSGDAQLRMHCCKTRRWGVPGKALTPAPPSTHTNPCHMGIKGVLLCVNPALAEGSRTEERTRMPHKQLCTRAPSQLDRSHHH